MFKNIFTMEKQEELFKRIVERESPEIVVITNAYFTAGGFIREKIIRQIYRN